MTNQRHIRTRAEQGDGEAIRTLVRSLELAGRLDEAVHWLERAATTSQDATRRFGELLPLPETDAPAAAEEWLTRLENVEHPRPMELLCVRLLRAGRLDTAVVWLRRLAQQPSGAPHSLITDFVTALDRDRRPDGANALLGFLAEQDNAHAARTLARRLAAEGKTEEAERWWQQAADQNDSQALWDLVRHYARQNREADLHRTLQRLADRDSRAAILLKAWPSREPNLVDFVELTGLTRRFVVVEPDMEDFWPKYRYGSSELLSRRTERVRRTRYLLATMPGQAPVSADIGLTVQVSGHETWGSVTARLKDFDSDRILVSVQAEEGLIALDDLEQKLDVPQEGPSEPIRFPFRTTRTGTFRVRVLAWAGGTFLAQLETRIVVTERSDVRDSTPAVAVLGSVKSTPGRTALLVQRRGDRFEFQLMSDMQPFEPAWSQALTADPQAAVDRTVAMLKRMAEGRTLTTASLARRWVKETGVGLWQDIVPPEIRDQFWQIRDRISSLTVVTNHDVLPWELLHPLRKGDDNGFLVEQFPVVRSVFGPELAHTVRLQPLACVVPGGSPADTADEIEKIQRMLGTGRGVIDNVDDLLDLIGSGSFGALHFACHNSFSVDDDGSKIAMPGGDFRPRLLNSAVTGQTLAAVSPLVFVNACRTAGAAPEYTRTTGWAQQFMAAGAGAFVGTLWPVRSSSARMFAEAFYEQLCTGKSLGEATYRARHETTRQDADPTWLAYTVYGNPSATAVRW